MSFHPTINKTKEKNQDPFPIEADFKNLEKLDFSPRNEDSKKDSNQKEKGLDFVQEKLDAKITSKEKKISQERTCHPDKLLGGKKTILYTHHETLCTPEIEMKFKDTISDGDDLLEFLQNPAFQDFLLGKEDGDKNEKFITMIRSVMEKNEDPKLQKQLAKFFIKNPALAAKIFLSKIDEKKGKNKPAINWLGLEKTLPKPFMVRISQEILQNENGESGKDSENNKNSKVA
jgi:hypothetical protein